MKKEFKIEIEKINLIYFKARQSFEIFKYFGKQDNIKDPFWIQIMYLSFKDTIIELDKLFSDNKNQKLRIKNFLKKLNDKGQYRSFKFNQQTLHQWENELILFTPTLNTIKNLRDSHFAHTDKNDSLGINTTSIDYRHVINNTEIENLYNFIEKILIKIYSSCGLGHLVTELFFTEKTIKIFENLNELQAYKQKEILNQLRNRKPSV